MTSLLTRELWPTIKNLLASGAPYALVFDDLGDPVIDFGGNDCYGITPEILTWIIKDAATRNERPFPPRMGIFLRQLGWYDQWGSRALGD